MKKYLFLVLSFTFLSLVFDLDIQAMKSRRTRRTPTKATTPKQRKQSNQIVTAHQRQAQSVLQETQKTEDSSCRHKRTAELSPEDLRGKEKRIRISESRTQKMKEIKDKIKALNEHQNRIQEKRTIEETKGFQGVQEDEKTHEKIKNLLEISEIIERKGQRKNVKIEMRDQLNQIFLNIQQRGIFSVEQHRQLLSYLRQGGKFSEDQKHILFYPIIRHILATEPSQRSDREERLLFNNPDIVDEIQREYQYRMEKEEKRHFYLALQQERGREAKIREILMTNPWHRSIEDIHVLEEDPELTNAIEEEIKAEELKREKAFKRHEVKRIREGFKKDHLNSSDRRKYSNETWKKIMDKECVSWDADDLAFLKIFPRELVLTLEEDTQEKIYEKLNEILACSWILRPWNSEKFLASFSEPLIEALEKQVQEFRELKKQQEEIEKEKKKLEKELELAQKELAEQEEQIEQEVVLEILAKQKLKLKKQQKFEELSEVEIVFKKLKRQEATLKELAEIKTKLRSIEKQQKSKLKELDEQKTELQNFEEDQEAKSNELAVLEKEFCDCERMRKLRLEELAEIEKKSTLMTIISTILNLGSEQESVLQQITKIERKQREYKNAQESISKELAEIKEKLENAKKQQESISRELTKIQTTTEKYIKKQNKILKELTEIKTMRKKIKEQQEKDDGIKDQPEPVLVDRSCSDFNLSDDEAL